MDGKVELPYHGAMPRTRKKADQMATLTVTSKGQVTLRKDVLQHLGVAAGQKLNVSKLPGGRVEVRAAVSDGRIEDLFGLLADKTRVRLSIDEISAVAAAGWAGKK
jgi:bifunctional DNA-binding transcriptional regulator/antitoxin component of YhaV-PrlF toxin-antitoxin module